MSTIFSCAAVFLCVFHFVFPLMGQGVVDIESSTQGLIPPRVSTASALACGNAEIGAIVYQTSDTSGLYICNGTTWEKVASIEDDQTLNEVLALGNNAGNQVITNLGTPVNASDAATKQYVDDQTGGNAINLIDINTVEKVVATLDTTAAALAFIQVVATCPSGKYILMPRCTSNNDGAITGFTRANTTSIDNSNQSFQCRTRVGNSGVTITITSEVLCATFP